MPVAELKRAGCPAPLVVRAEMRRTSAGSAACERAIDAFADRLGSDGAAADVAGIAGACPPADRAAAEAVLDARERDALARPPAEGACDARAAVEALDDDAAPGWLDAQACAAGVVPRRAGALALERARAWPAERLADCLDRCVLDGATRAELERLERGDGYEARIRRKLGEAGAAIGRMASVAEAAPIAEALRAVAADIHEHGRALGARADALGGDTDRAELRLAARLPGVAEIELINLSMRAATELDVIERLIPDPIDVASASAEVDGGRATIDRMRGVVTGAQGVLATAADWTAQIEAFEKRFRAASARVDARIQRRQATLELVGELCRLDRDRDAADVAARKDIDEQRRGKLKQLRGYKAGYDRRRDCR
jgi:hypothetical protein